MISKSAWEYEFSVIIPALHEAERVNSTVGRIYDQMPCENFEIIVADGDPDGDTANHIRCERVRTIISRKGRALQMNAGAAISRGEVLVFLHADTQLPEDAFRKIRLAMEQERYVGGAFDLGIDSDRLVYRIIEWGANLRSRLNRIPYGDQAIFIRKDHFDRIGGYKNLPFLEDVEMMQRLKRRGDKICLLPDRVRTSPRRWENEGIIYCTLRNWIIAALYFMGVSPHKLLRYYRSGHNVCKNR